MRVKLEIGGDVILHCAFHRIHGFTGCDACAVADAEDMRVHGLGGLLPPHVEHHIGGFAAYAGQRLQGSAGVGHDACVVIDEDLAQLDHVLGLLTEKADCFDMLDQCVETEVEHLLGCIGDLEQGAGRFVHTNVCGLCRQRNGHNESVDVHMLKLAFGFWIGFLEPLHDGANGVIIELF